MKTVGQKVIDAAAITNTWIAEVAPQHVLNREVVNV